MNPRHRNAYTKHPPRSMPKKKNPQLSRARRNKRKIQSAAFYQTCITFTPLLPSLPPSFFCYQQKQSRLAAAGAPAASASSGSPRVLPLSRFKRLPVFPHIQPHPLFLYLSRCNHFNPSSERLSSKSATRSAAC